MAVLPLWRPAAPDGSRAADGTVAAKGGSASAAATHRRPNGGVCPPPGPVWATPSVVCAVDTGGADRLPLGSDRPHVIGDRASALRTVRALPLDDQAKAGILGAHARALLDF